MKIRVLHSYYGCDTGCCGHVIEVDGEELIKTFEFDHPYGKKDYMEFARQMVRDHFGEDHVKDLDWDNCEVLGDDCWRI